MDHTKYMRYCIALGKLAKANGDPPVGAILESGRSTGDITNHAEILAIKNAISNGKSGLLNEATLYSTHEACIMCSYMIRHHKIPVLVFGTSVKDLGGYSSEFKVLNTKNIPKWGNNPKIIIGVLEEECLALHTM